ncbi:heterogeneous nuclear ribonucleoprotein 1 [Raphanus sativus]|uniref:Heterogeneous nuclear ribonucleoprotein 1 n=1 Tax=Raphanus sativus TaxID=3726 RepID=A0A6J0LEF5_RAPSA|nr:heterogeneous nuclear ribonucleoprotein 1 [Raphanus sativus]
MEMESCKLFIGGISWETTEDRLREYFQSFGEVLEAVIMKDRATGRARGFGFLVFADPIVAERVVLIRHVIDGKIVEAKKAVPRDDTHVVLNRSNSSLQGSPGPATSKKIFVGGLASSVTEAEFKKYFAQFGVITDVVVMYDHRTQRPRGFGFISFETEEAVDRVLQRTFHELNGKMVEVKPAVPKEMALNPIRNQMNVNSFGSGGRLGALLMNEYARGLSLSPGYGVQPEVRYSPAVGGNNRGGGFSPFGHGFGIELNFEQGQSQSYGSGSNAGFVGRPFSPGYAASHGRFGGSQVESGGGNGSVLNAAAKNNLWGNGGGLGYMSNSPISRSSFNGNSGMSSSLGSIGDSFGRARSGGYRSEGGGGGVGLEAMRGVHVGGYSSSGGSSSMEADSLYSDSAWLSSLPAKAEERLGMGAFDFMSKGPAGYINRQPNGGIAA